MRWTTPLFLTVVLAACNSTSYTTEMQPLTQSPAASKRQAEKICTAQAGAASARVSAAYQTSEASYGDSFSGGFAESFENALGNSIEAASVKRNVEEACLARYGWEEVRVPLDG